MKALKSDLAKQVLSDPKGKELLRTYLANKVPSQTPTGAAHRSPVIEVRSAEGSTIRVRPVIVPKAA